MRNEEIGSKTKQNKAKQSKTKQSKAEKRSRKERKKVGKREEKRKEVVIIDRSQSNALFLLKLETLLDITMAYKIINKRK